MSRSDSRGRSGSRQKKKSGGGRETGTINTWNVDKQFGFVSCTSSNRADLFLHAEYFENPDQRNKAKNRGLRRGDKVEFDIQEPAAGKRSAQAVRAELLETVDRSPSDSRSRSRGRGGRGGGGGGRGPPPRAQIEFRPGDWECPSCRFHNFARNTNCMKCDTSKNGGGGGRRGGGGGRRRDSRSRGRDRDRRRSPSRRRGGRSRRRSPSRSRSSRSGSRRRSPPRKSRDRRGGDDDKDKDKGSKDRDDKDRGKDKEKRSRSKSRSASPPPKKSGGGSRSRSRSKS